MAAGGPLRGLDGRLDTLALRDGPHLLPSGLAQFLADLGNTVVAVPVALAALLLVVWRALRGRAPRRWRPVAAALAVPLLVPALVVPLKALFARPAPPGPLSGTSGFFPSGHAATAVAAYAGAALLLSAHARRTLTRWVLGAAAAVLNAATALGLVVCGYHWPLDVVGSWSLCGALLAVVWGWAWPTDGGVPSGRRPGPPA